MKKARRPKPTPITMKPRAQGHRSFTTQYFNLRKDPNSQYNRGLVSRAGYVGVEGVFSRGVAVLTAKH